MKIEMICRRFLKTLAILATCLFWQSNAFAEHTIQVGLDDDVVPLAFRGQGGELIGFDIELSQEVFRRMNIPIQYKVISYEDQDNALLVDKTVDIIWSAKRMSEERKKKYLFTIPYLIDGSVLVVKSDSDIYEKQDLVGKTIATRSGGINVKRLEKMKNKGEIGDYRAYKDLPIAISSVFTGKSDAVFFASNILRYYVKNSRGKLRIVDIGDPFDGRGVIMRHSETELANKINKALTDMKADGSFDKLSKRWFGEELRQKLPEDGENMKDTKPTEAKPVRTRPIKTIQP